MSDQRRKGGIVRLTGGETLVQCEGDGVRNTGGEAERRMGNGAHTGFWPCPRRVLYAVAR